MTTNNTNIKSPLLAAGMATTEATAKTKVTKRVENCIGMSTRTREISRSLVKKVAMNFLKLYTLDIEIISSLRRPYIISWS